MNPIGARRRLIRSYEETVGYRLTARLWHTSRHVVPKWVRRYRELGEWSGGSVSPAAPLPHQTRPEIEQQVMAA